MYKTQAHLKPYQPQDKKVEGKLLSQSTHMQTVKTLNSKCKIDNLVQSRLKRDINPKLNWIYKEYCNHLAIRLDITCFLHLH